MQQILDFLHQIEKLKKELRHSRLSDARQESVAEHTRRTAMMVLLLADKLDQPIDICHALKLAVIHDISEVFVGDMPAFDTNRANHKELEQQKMLELKSKYDSDFFNQIYDLRIECEQAETLEAKFVKALDKMEVRIQHNEADISTWNDLEFPRSQFVADKHCEYDSFLYSFNNMIKQESKQKIINESDKDFNAISKQAEELRNQK